MLEYFKRLFEYDFWANEKALVSLEAAPELPEEALKKISHTLMAKALWLSRLTPGIVAPAWDAILSIAESKKLNGDLKAQCTDYLSRLKPEQLAEKIAYKNTKGAPYENVLSDILTHMVNHGSYHRGQIASLVNRSGGKPAGTDYIGYVRE